MRSEFESKQKLERTALQAMYAASRRLGKKGVLELVRSLAHPDLPAEFRNTTLRYLQNGRQDNTNDILAALKRRGILLWGTQGRCRDIWS